MMKYTFRYASHPKDVEGYRTEELREHFLIESLFELGHISLTYSMYDRYIVGGAMPSSAGLKLETIPYLKTEHFLDRRELGIINIGDTGTVEVDGEHFNIEKNEALYIGKGSKEIVFSNASGGGQALFYLNSAPAHKSYPIKLITKEEAEVVQFGEPKYSNCRKLYKLIVNSTVETCQLQMGIAQLLDGNVWNTMPAHTHERRMEAYFYYDIQSPQTVCHFMGQAKNTRHIFVQNNQAVLCPEWSIHSGVGTSNYSFIWGMAGETLDYNDKDEYPPNELR